MHNNRIKKKIENRKPKGDLETLPSILGKEEPRYTYLFLISEDLLPLNNFNPFLVHANKQIKMRKKKHKGDFETLTSTILVFEMKK